MGIENRVELAIYYREAEKESRVDFVLIVSTVTSDLTNALIAKPFTQLESKLSNVEEATVYTFLHRHCSLRIICNSKTPF